MKSLYRNAPIPPQVNSNLVYLYAEIWSDVSFNQKKSDLSHWTFPLPCWKTKGLVLVMRPLSLTVQVFIMSQAVLDTRTIEMNKLWSLPSRKIAYTSQKEFYQGQKKVLSRTKGPIWQWSHISSLTWASSKCGNKQRPSKWKKWKKQRLFLQFAIAKLSAIVICILTETQREEEEWENFVVE